MKPPKFADLHRFFYLPYTPSNASDVRRLFEAVRRIRAEAAARDRVDAELRLRGTITTLKRKA